MTWVGWSALWLVLAAEPNAIPPRPEPTREAFAESLQAETAGNYQAAIQALSPLSMTYAVQLRVGWLNYLAGDYERSAKFYRMAIQTQPQATEPRVGYLLPLLALQRFGEAEGAARDVLRIDPSNYYAHLRLAYALRMQYQFHEAIAVCQRMLALQPTDLKSLAELGLNYAALQQPAAGEVFTQLLAVDPNNATALQHLGQPAIAPPPVPPDVPATWGEPPLSLGAIPYVAWIEYGSGALKDNGFSTGVYGFFSFGHLLEASASLTDLSYHDGSRLEQFDSVLVYTHTLDPAWKLRLGGHYIANNDSASNGAWTAITGLHCYEFGKWDAGFDAYFSRYDGQSNANVLQFSPHFGLEQRTGDNVRLRADCRLYYINTEESVLDTGREDFVSLEGRLEAGRDPWSVALFGWTGRQAFAVRCDGFLIYNLAEVHTGGFGVETRYRCGPGGTLTCRVADELLADITRLTGSHQIVATLLFTQTF